ncbi:uncharacterized protein [Diadema antillarum]|uniref:uncharacterized protein n=1 Tax=Diadema antillarum TaxID=105358 RepID=UPI003A835820
MSDHPDHGSYGTMAPDTKYCSNCKRDIASSNFLMHEVHCRRNISLCQTCQEPIPRSEMEAHYEEYHKPVACKCGEMIERSKLEDHETNDCQQRKEHCEYCELELTHVEMVEHLTYCGSRTERCPKCQRYIQNRDRKQHELSDCAFPEHKPPARQTSSSSAGFGFFDDDLEGYDETTVHAVTNRFALPQYVDSSHTLPRMNSRTPYNVNTSHTISRDQFYGANAVSRLDSEGSKQEKGGEGRSRRQRKNQDRVQNIYKNTNQRRPVASKKKDATKPSNTAAADQLETDRLLALRLANGDSDFLVYDPLVDPFVDVDDLSSGVSPPRREPDNDLFSQLTQVGYGSTSPTRERTSSLSRSLSWQTGSEGGVDDAGILSDVVMAPCEFCGNAFPLDDLIQHQSGCQLYNYDELLEPLMPATELSNNQRSSCLSSTSLTQTPMVDNLGRTNQERLISPDSVFLDRDSPDEGAVMLPCEFCGTLLPSDAIPYHQYHCKDTKPSNEEAIQDVTNSHMESMLASSRTKSWTRTPESPPRERNSRRRQEDITSHNLFSSDLESTGESQKNSALSRQSTRQSAKTNRPSGQGEFSNRLRSKGIGATGSSRTRKGLGLNEGNRNKAKPNPVNEDRSKENESSDLDLSGSSDFLLPNPIKRESTVPFKSSNRTKSKSSAKKPSNSETGIDNIFSRPSALNLFPQGDSRLLNNSSRQADSLSRYQGDRSDFVSRQEEEDQLVGGAKKRGKAERQTFNGVRSPASEGYVPSFGETEPGGNRVVGGRTGGRIRKTADSQSVR